MAPTAVDVKWQTEKIIHFLFNEEDVANYRMSKDCLETDCGDDKEDTFDPIVIADKLKSVADALNKDVKFEAALKELKVAVASEAAEAAFNHGVELLCQSHVAQKAEVAPEVQLIRASVTFGLFVKQSCPELKRKVQEAMTSFLNRRVGSWVLQKGGWEKAVLE